MPIHIEPLDQNTDGTRGLEVSWEGCQFVMVVARKGLVSCGVIDREVMERFGAAIAIARGTPEKPLVTTEDLLSARIAEVTDEAARLGVSVGMTGREALGQLEG